MQPYVFDDFFSSGKEESVSPFLKPSSRKWGHQLELKAALLAAFMLALAFVFSFFHEPASYVCLSVVFFLSGTPALIGALDDIKQLEINIDVLMTVAALLSIAIGSGMEGALLLVLFELSAAMELSASQKARSSLTELHALSPRFGCVIGTDGVLYERSIKEIEIGTLLLVKAGEVIPLDGLVTDGSSFINLSHLTGESHPVPKHMGDEVQAGAYNLDGTLTIKVSRTSRDSTLTKIIELVTHAQESKPRLERLLDKFGKTYAMTIMLLALFFAIALPFIWGLPYLGQEGSIYRALTFLIAASPCALILATPTAYLSAISCCARKGIILKGGILFDALVNCHSVAFDKTGTLTTGALTCKSMQKLAPSATHCDDQTALAIAAALERHVVHPIASAITAYAQEHGVSILPLEQFRSIPGRGLEAVVQLSGDPAPIFVAIGHPSFISSKLPFSLEKDIQKAGHLHALLLVGDALFAFYFTDTIRPEAQAAIEQLKENHRVDVCMLTGDHLGNAHTVAQQVGISEIFADLRPEHKYEKVAELSRQKGLVMVGDGINDAPALARSTVGISMGKIGSATAVDASDIVLLQDDLRLVPWVKAKADQTLRIVKQNLTLALCVICLASTPALLGLVPLWVAVLLHEGGTVLVGLNSLRLLRQTN